MQAPLVGCSASNDVGHGDGGGRLGGSHVGVESHCCGEDTVGIVWSSLRRSSRSSVASNLFGGGEAVPPGYGGLLLLLLCFLLDCRWTGKV
jgi:hypothetical protein